MTSDSTLPIDSSIDSPIDSPIESTAAGPIWHSSFYKFATILDPPSVAVRLKALSTHVSGSILLATEGVNGMVAARLDALDAFEQALLHEFDGVFEGMQFKRSACLTKPFKHMKVKVKREIVALGVSGVNAINRPRQALEPKAWRDLIARDDVVVLDNRNSFEFKLGRFKGAVDPAVLHFRDFPGYIEAQVPQWKAAGKKVAMYCTGGIRCEKTSAWMQDMGVDVFELQGGILNYFQQMPDAEKDWQGECFVFDNRVALDSKLQETDTPIEEVYKDEPDREWRISRALRLAASEDD
jgi:UPF0176 protein